MLSWLGGLIAGGTRGHPQFSLGLSPVRALNLTLELSKQPSRFILISLEIIDHYDIFVPRLHSHLILLVLINNRRLSLSGRCGCGRHY